MIRGLLLVSFYLVTSFAFGAPSELVSFTSGNQIHGSVVTIFSDGTVEHGERTCCPPRVETVTEERLTAVQLSHLESLIRASAPTPLLIKDGSPTTFGSQSGELLAYLNGKPLIIFQVERNSQPGQLNIVTYNPAPTASEIKKMVEAYVKDPLVP
jgi:hypothetical protein